jgi:hypothetical protein
MVPLWFMPAGAVLFVAGASAVAGLRQFSRQRVTRDGLAALAAAAAGLLAAIGCYSLPELSRNAGALATFSIKGDAVRLPPGTRMVWKTSRYGPDLPKSR